jgi:predicted regulator of Ras-like GTPase activity (Roadblock/LC7/MglB family)
MAALLLDAELGRVCTVGRHDLVLVVVAEPRVNLGLVLVEMLKAAEALR